MSELNSNVIVDKSQVISGIYKIENLINHKVYIGQSIDIYQRWYHHKYNAFLTKEYNRYQYNSYFYKSIRKYGLENFSFQIIKETYDLDYWEMFLIQVYHSNDINYGYNLSLGGDGGWEFINRQIKNGEMNHPMTNHIWTDEQKKNMSNGRKGKYKGNEHYFSKMSKEERIKFVKEKCGTFTSNWWTNGKINIRAEECPQGFWKGQTSNKQKSIKCLNNNKTYRCCLDACRDLNIHPSTLNHYLKYNINDDSKNCKGYKFILL